MSCTPGALARRLVIADGHGRGWFIALFLSVIPSLWMIQVRPGLAAPFRVMGMHGPVTIPSYLPGDCVLYRAAAASLLADGDLDLRNNVDWTVVRAEGNVAVSQNGAWVPKHPLLLPILALPLFAVAGDPGLLAFNLMELALLDGLVLWLAMRFVRPGVAFATALLFALTTLLRPLAYNFSPDVLSSVLVVGGIAALLERRFAWSGLLLGLSVAAKWTNVAFLVPTAVAVVASGRWRGLARFATGVAPALLALACLNWHWFGSPLVTPYDRVLPAAGDPAIRDAFDVPFWRGLWAQLTDPRLGLVVSAPPVLIAVPGFAFLWRRSRSEALLLLSCVVLQIVIFAPYRYWSASVAGHRFLLTAIVLCAPAAALELERFADALHRRRHPAACTGAPGSSAA
jgi:hypothetical protein